jgi:tetratricopeptide (TPR) repeat protein
MKKAVFAVLLFFTGFVLFAQQRPDALREYRNSNFERAVEICREEISSVPNNLESHVVICWSLIRLRRYEEARTFALAGREISRYDPRIIEILGEVYYFQGHNNDALGYFQEYVNLAPQGSRIDTVYYYIGELFIRLGKFYHADIALSTAVYYMPQNADWWARLGYARENAGEYTEAIAAYEKALSLNAQLSGARMGLERARQSNR